MGQAEHTPMAKSRGLITDTERDRIAGRTTVEDAKRYQAISRVRRRIQEELPDEIALLRDHHPKLLAELHDEVCDGDDPDDIRSPADARVRKLEDRNEDLRADRDRLQAQLDEDASRVDVHAVRRALDDVEAAAERGDGAALQDALRRARQALPEDGGRDGV